MWKSDGTSAGTIRVKDIRPGPRSSSLGNLINLGGTLYFTANDGTGAAIWKSNGTEAGTQIVDHVDAGLLTNVQGLLYFISSDELWRTDGSPSGAVMLKQVASSPDTFVTEMAAVGNRLFISVYGGATDELWVSDGTELGTTLVDTLSSATLQRYSHPDWRGGTPLLPLDEHVVPQSEFQQSSAQLWTSDGTPGSTRLVKNFVPGHPDYVDNLIAAQGRAFFVVDGELHKSTGGAGTKTLGASAFSSPPLTIVGGTIFFVGPGGIWKTDGSAAGIQHVTDAEPRELVLQPTWCPCNVVFRDYDPAGAAGRSYFHPEQRDGVELWTTQWNRSGRRARRRHLSRTRRLQAGRPDQGRRCDLLHSPTTASRP